MDASHGYLCSREHLLAKLLNIYPRKKYCMYAVQKNQNYNVFRNSFSFIIIKQDGFYAKSLP
jgi:hypothetical protein